MRIAFLIPELQRTETFILSQVDAIRARGHDVEIVTRSVGQDETLGPYRDYCRFIPSRADGRFTRTLAGIPLAARCLTRNPRAVASSLNPFRFGRYAASFDLLQFAAPFMEAEYDIVHCHFGPAGVFGAMLKAIGLVRGPLIVTFYGHDVTRYPLEHGRHVYDRLFDHASLVLGLDPVMVDRLVELGAPRERTRVHALGVTADRFDVAPMPADTPLRLVAVGRLVDKKGFDDAINAIALARRAGTDVELVVAGDGPRLEHARHLAVALGVDESISFLGHVSHAEVPALLASAHALIAPSRRAEDGDEEGTPTVIIEAMACGRPVLATRHAGIPYLLDDGSTGVIVPERDPEQLAAGIAALADPLTRKQFARGARERFLAHFRADVLGDRLIEHYRGALAESE